MPLQSPSPTAPGLTCAGCGWVESPGATECRSCGDPMPVKGMAYAPARPEAHPDALAEIRPANRPPLPRTPGRTVTAPAAKSHFWPALRQLGSGGRGWALLAVLIGLWQFSAGRPVTHPPGILIAEEPVQGPVPAGHEFRKSGDANIRSLASYSIKARVLHRERYRWERMADIAPIDLGVGWGVMSDETNVARCTFSNSTRYLSWQWSGDDFPAEAATVSMTNMHMLPANDRVRDRLLSLRPGQLIQAGGFLVEVTRPGTGPWTSSLTRLDTGNGACEIMWVESLMVIP